MDSDGQGRRLATPRPNTFTAAAEPWAFVHASPLTSTAFADEAKKRGIKVDDGDLRALWRAGILAPFVQVTSRRVTPGVPREDIEPFNLGARSDLVEALERGRLVDPDQNGYRPQYRFAEPQRSRVADRPWHERWWNGFLYSQWQLFDLHWAAPLLNAQRARGGRLPPLATWHQQGLPARRRRAALLVALEGRYLPETGADHIVIRPDITDDWHRFRENFDPLETLARVGWRPEELPALANHLLALSRDINPLGDRWMDLIARSSPRAWDDLKGDASVALDYLRAAEMVMRCVEDIGLDVGALPLGDRPRRADQRISHRSQSLDNSLARLGLSPNYKAILVLEGETEEELAPYIRDRLRIPKDRHALRIVVLRGVTKDLTKLAALALAPLIDDVDAERGLLRMSRPPTYLLIAVDPDRPFDTPEGIEKERNKILDEFKYVMGAQGYVADREQLSELVTIETWTGGKFEFSHFSDDELVGTLMKLEPTRDEATLRRSIAQRRANREDISNIWKKKERKTSKVALAKALKELLLQKVDAAMLDHDLPLPEIAQRMLDAYYLGARVTSAAYWISGVQVAET